MALYVKKLNEAIEILTANLDDKVIMLLEIENILIRYCMKNII